MSMHLFFIIAGIAILFLVVFTLAQTYLEKSFKSLSYDLLERNQQSFFSLASSFFEKYQEGFEGKHKELAYLLEPLKENLSRLESETREMEKKRISAYSSLFEQIEQLMKSENILRKETSELSRALRSPNVRGSWGEMHLQRVVELAGLKAYCDFYPQQTLKNEDKTFRPDLLIKLPENRFICIDAKTPLETFLETEENVLDEKAKEEKLKEYTFRIKQHIKELSKKSYYDQISKKNISLEYVILFLPAESFLSAALAVDPTLMEQAALSNVILATPTTLIAILRAIAQTWQKLSFSENTEEILRQGKELKERIEVFLEHFQKLGKSISQSAECYNQTTSSLKSRIFPTLKKLNELSLNEKNEAFEKIEEIEKKITLEKFLDKNSSSKEV